MLGSLPLLALLPGCTYQSKKISIAAGIWQGYELMFLAQRQGWLSKDLVHLAEVPSNTSSIHALSSGIVQGAALTLDEVFRARAGGVPLTIVLVLDNSAGADMLLARPQIKSLHDLKGKRIGVEQGANAALMLAKALQKAGLVASDVKQVAVAIGDHVDAWEHDRIDAVITYEPAASHLLNEGAVRLFDSKQIPDTIVDVLAIRSEALTEEYAEAIRNLVAGHFNTLNFLLQHPKEAAGLMAAHLGLPPDQVLKSYEGIVLPDIKDNYRLLAGAYPALMNTAHTVSSFMTESKLIPTEATFTGLVSAAYLPQDK